MSEHADIDKLRSEMWAAGPYDGHAPWLAALDELEQLRTSLARVTAELAEARAALRPMADACRGLLAEVYVGDGKVIAPPALVPHLRAITAILARQSPPAAPLSEPYPFALKAAMLLSQLSSKKTKPATFSAVVERAILEVYEAGRESAGIAAPLPEPVKVAGAWHNVGGYQLQMRCPCCEQPIAEISYGPFDHPCRYTIASKRGAPATQHTANSADEAKASVGVALRAAGWTLRDGTEKP